MYIIYSLVFFNTFFGLESDSYFLEPSKLESWLRINSYRDFYKINILFSGT